jgi:hypothetical protein
MVAEVPVAIALRAQVAGMRGDTERMVSTHLRLAQMAKERGPRCWARWLSEGRLDRGQLAEASASPLSMLAEAGRLRTPPLVSPAVSLGEHAAGPW